MMDKEYIKLYDGKVETEYCSVVYTLYFYREKRIFLLLAHGWGLRSIYWGGDVEEWQDSADIMFRADPFIEEGLIIRERPYVDDEYEHLRHSETQSLVEAVACEAIIRVREEDPTFRAVLSFL